MNKFLSVLFLFVAACSNCQSDDLRDKEKCGAPCSSATYVSDKYLGECKKGIYDCSGEKPVCLGFVDPQEEICDQKDNDCDGIVDVVRKKCETKCGAGFSVCKQGIWLDCDAPYPEGEICNNLDDDCDGIKDEREELPIEFCYHGPNGTVGIGECRPGVYVCERYGRQRCNDIRPTIELCDGLDNDCDGVIDEGFNAKPHDVVFVYDNSRSMASYRAQINDFLDLLQSRFLSNDAFQRFALVTVPDNDPIYAANPYLYSNFVDFQTIKQKIALQETNSDIIDENTLDALFDISHDSNPFHLNWTANSAKMVVMFADEIPQSNIYNLDMATVGTIFLEKNIDIFIYTDNSYIPDWKQLTDISDGFTYSLEQSYAKMFEDFNGDFKDSQCR